jgi:hypothetical protein
MQSNRTESWPMAICVFLLFFHSLSRTKFMYHHHQLSTTQRTSLLDKSAHCAIAIVQNNCSFPPFLPFSFSHFLILRSFLIHFYKYGILYTLVVHSTHRRSFFLFPISYRSPFFLSFFLPSPPPSLIASFSASASAPFPLHPTNSRIPTITTRWAGTGWGCITITITTTAALYELYVLRVRTPPFSLLPFYLSFVRSGRFGLVR